MGKALVFRDGKSLLNFIKQTKSTNKAQHMNQHKLRELEFILNHTSEEDFIKLFNENIEQITFVIGE